MGYRWVRKVQGKIEEIMTEVGLDDIALAQKVLAGANAETPKGHPDWFARVKFAELAAKMKGLLKDRVDHVASGTITIRVKGRDYSKVESKPIKIDVTDAEVLEIPEKVER